MSVLRLKYKDKKGKIKKVKNKYVEFRDHNKILRRIPAYADKGASTTLEGKIMELVKCRRLEILPTPELLDWFDNRPKVRNRLAGFGLLDAAKANHRSKQLIDYLPGFEQTIKLGAEKKHSKQAKMTVTRARNIIEGCGFVKWQDVDGGKVDLYIHRLQESGLGKQTAQFYVKAFRRFARWMVANSYGRQYWPLNEEKGIMQGIRGVKVKRSIERYFEIDEYVRLLRVAQSGPDSYGLTGYQRYLLYQLAVETGLRRDELRSLTSVSFNFKKRTVFVKGEHTKNGDDAEQDISPELTQLMREYVRAKMPTVRLFNIHDKSAKMIQADCEAAGIDVVNIRGKIKFHTLRHTCATFLIHEGANLKQVQEVMRHKSIDITISRYGHLLDGQRKSAVARLGKLAGRQAATGTD